MTPPRAEGLQSSLSFDDGIATLNHEPETAPEIDHVRETVHPPIPRHVIVGGGGKRNVAEPTHPADSALVPEREGDT